VAPFPCITDSQNLLILQAADHGGGVQPFEGTARGRDQPGVITMNAGKFAIGIGTIKRDISSYWA
jgi:hypothetical protein